MIYRSKIDGGSARTALDGLIAEKGPLLNHVAVDDATLSRYEGRLPPPKGQKDEDWEDREQTLFRATKFGDDVDRPLLKSDGSYTYFANDIAYHRSKFVRGFPEMLIENPVWPLSDERAHAVRRLLAEGRLDERRVQRVTAFGDKKPRNSNAMDPANNRVEVILLR